MSNFSVLIADDEPELRQGLKSLLAGRDFHIQEASHGQEAWNLIQAKNFDLVLMDVRMPQMSGLEVLKKVRDFRPSTTVVVITAQANVKDAVQAIQDGAFDYIEKPLQADRLNELIDKTLETRDLIAQIAFTRPRDPSQAPGTDNSKSDFLGHSKPMQKVFQLIDRLANVNTSVLIRGETGTGKTLVARGIHSSSPRKHRPFVVVDCAAISGDLIESELFGHEKGAVPNSHQRYIGKLQYASGGTVFLQEITALKPSTQLKLLSVIKDQVMLPLGSNREVKVDVRILAGTARNIEKLMQENLFRPDLFYALNVMPLFLPPLRERLEDLEPLIKSFITKMNEKHLRFVQGVKDDALVELKKYSWPGNIRELEASVEHAFVMESGPHLGFDAFPSHLHEAIMDAEEGWNLQKAAAGNQADGIKGEFVFSLNYQEDKERFEKEFIIQALRSCGGRINQTCEAVQIPKNTLLRKIKKYGINAKDYE